MITRHLRAGAPAVVLAFSVLATSCQKVPLLAPSGSSITLTSQSTALASNGTTLITAQVIEPSGTPPHAGTLVSFSTTLGRIQPAEAETDISGRATVTFSANGASGMATITAISGGVSQGENGAIRIALGAAAVSAVIASASPISLPSSGGTSTISAIVNDTGGNPIGGIAVTFTTDAGTLSQSVVTTDTAGIARTTLTTARTAKVTATAGVAGTSGTTTTPAPSATVTVQVNAISTITLGTPTPAVPGVGQTVSIPVTYGGTSPTPLSSVTVNWGDGQSQTYTGQPTVIAHSYGAAGSYLITATGADTFGDSSTTSASITITNSRPSVGLTVSNERPSTGQSITYNISATIPGSPTNVALQSIRLEYGDGGAVDLGAAVPTSAPSHSYTAAGTYVARVTATATNGQTGSASATIVVQ